MPRRSAVNVLAAFAIAIAIALLAHPAGACAFHTYKPEKTAIDWLIETDHLVAARSDPENAFAYRAVETLLDGGQPVVLSELVDSGMRRKLAAHPEDVVLFAHDVATGTWRRVAYLTPAYRRLVEMILSEKDNWTEPYDASRFEIFEALQDHPERALRDLALREIDKAPYEILRGIDLKIPVEDLLAALGTPQAYPYQSIRALLLGLSGDDAARARLRSYIDAIAGWDRGTDHLGAFATALVEIDGLQGVARLDDRIIADPGQPLDKLEQVVEALAIHNGVGSPDLRGAIAGTLGRLVQTRPEAAPLIARQFGGRQDWSQAAPLQGVVRERRLSSTADLLTVAVYLAQAKGAGALQTVDAQGG